MLIFYFAELQDPHSSGKKSWMLTDIADHTQLGSPKRLDDKRRLIESFSTHNDSSVDERVRRIQQQLEEMEIRVQESNKRAIDFNRRAVELNNMLEESVRRAEEADMKAEEADRRAEEADGRAEVSDQQAERLQRRAEEADRRAEESDRRVAEVRQQQQRSLADMRLRLRECEDLLQAYDAQWVVKREEIELTGPELGRGAWATVSVAKFRGAQVAVKRIHNQLVS